MLKIKEGFNGQRVLVLPKSVVDTFANDLFGSQLHVTDIGYFPQAEYHYCSRERGAAEFIFIYCREGRGWVKIGNGPPEELRSGQFIIIPAHTPHAYGASEQSPWTIYWVHFGGAYSANFALGFDHPTTIYPTPNIKVSLLLQQFEMIFETLKSGCSKENIRFAMSNMYGFLGSMTYLSIPRAADAGLMPQLGQIERAIDILKDNLDKKITLDELCAQLGCSASSLSGKFKERIGYSPMSYLNHLRIQEACRYLDYTDMTISQISARIGIEDPCYFSRLFTMIMGQSPTVYRKEQKW